MLNTEQKSTLRDVARRSIEYGLQHHQALPVQTDHYDAALQTHKASFVTLKHHGEMRGCIGTLEPVRPLVEDVAHNAFAAAFQDARFPLMQADELAQLVIHISILGPPEPLQFESEQQLLAQLQAGIDGLILNERNHRATFLPSVWESLQEPRGFLRQLKRKAGLPADYWSDTIKIQRYQVENF